MIKKYSLVEISKEINKSNDKLQFHLIIFLIISIFIRLTPLVTAAIISLIINKNLDTHSYSITEKLIILIPASLSTIYIVNKISEWILMLLNRLYFISIMIEAGSSFCSRAFSALVHMPIEEVAKKQPEEWANLLNKRQEVIGGFALLYSHLIPLFLELLLISFFILISGQKLIAFIFIFSVFLNLFARFKIMPKMELLLKKYFHAEAKMVIKSYEFISKIYLVKLFHSEQFLINLRLKREKEEIFLYKKQREATHLLVSFQEFIILLALVLCFLIGYNEVNNKTLSMGAFIAVLTLISAGFSQFGNITFAFDGILSLREISQTHMHILKHPVTNMNKELNHTTEKSELILKNISFAYSPENKILNDINLHINYREKVFLIGYSGSGKTTLLKLLLNLVPQQEGVILYNNKTQQDVFSYIPQSLDLFDDSIKNNLLLGNSQANDEKILLILNLVNILEKIQKIGGIDMNVNNLSGGEKQRIAIARALISEKPIMLMDEPTSSLDVKNEKIIIDEIIHSDITAIISIHRIHSIPLNSRCIVLDNGKITQDGILKKLITEEGMIKHLWNTKEENITV